MFERPALAVPKYEKLFPSGLMPLWIQTLDRSDAGLRRLTIDTLAIAHERGVADVQQAKAPLIELLSQPQQDLDTVASAARTLVVLESIEAAQSLADAAIERGSRIANIVEPAFAKWKSPVLKKNWIERLDQANVTDSMLLLAIDGVGAIGAKEADSALYRIAVDPDKQTTVRLRAAKALGAIGASQSLSRATQLAASDPSSKDSRVIALLVVAMLSSDKSPQAIELLGKLSADSNSVVQAASLKRLFEIDPAEVDALADNLVASPDVNVRRHCIRAMLDNPRRERIASIAPHLDDVNPTLRREVTTGLLRWAESKELRSEVIAQTMRVMQNDSWRSCEQACVVMAKLDHKPAGSRMVDLLGHRRGEVRVASAWGLTQLRDPQYLSDMLQHAEAVCDGFMNGQFNDSMPGMSLQMAHLFVAFGDQMYAPANAVLRLYLPKNFDMGMEARSAGCWAIGLINAKEPSEELLSMLEGRFMDTNSMEPEDDGFRSMCAIAFGRMKLEDKLPDLRRSVGTGRCGQACYWAIEQMTGEKTPPIPVRRLVQEDWFLAPVAIP
ncbi:hypothetical protein [Planctomycetes bacterium K23_9]